ncbi:MAG TPA: hypothetical protein VIK93_11175, partial [Limnochordales bacterium]
RVDFEAFAAAHLSSPAIAALAERVFVHAGDEFNRRFPDKWGARVTVVHRDGRLVSGEVEVPTGDWRQGVTEELLVPKWQATLAVRFAGDRAREIVDAWLRLEQAPDVRPLMDLLA